MPLNITSTADFDPYVKYNAKSGRWYNNEDSEINSPVFIADFANIKTGWFLFLEGQAPDKVLDSVLGQQGAKPSDTHKRGFVLRLFSSKSFGGVVELSGSSMHLNNAITDLYNQYDSAAESKEGKLPVVAFTGSTPSKDKFGTNYKPNFTIEKWVDRPAEFDASGAPTPEATVQQPDAPSQAATTGASEF